MRLELALIRPRRSLDGVRRSSEPSHVLAIKAGGYEDRRGSADHLTIVRRKGFATNHECRLMQSLGEVLAGLKSWTS